MGKILLNCKKCGKSFDLMEASIAKEITRFIPPSTYHYVESYVCPNCGEKYLSKKVVKSKL